MNNQVKSLSFKGSHSTGRKDHQRKKSEKIVLRITTGNQGLCESREERMSDLVCGVRMWVGERVACKPAKEEEAMPCLWGWEFTWLSEGYIPRARNYWKHSFLWNLCGVWAWKEKTLELKR